MVLMSSLTDLISSITLLISADACVFWISAVRKSRVRASNVGYEVKVILDGDLGLVWGVFGFLGD